MGVMEPRGGVQRHGGRAPHTKPGPSGSFTPAIIPEHQLHAEWSLATSVLSRADPDRRGSKHKCPCGGGQEDEKAVGQASAAKQVPHRPLILILGPRGSADWIKVKKLVMGRLSGMIWGDSISSHRSIRVEVKEGTTDVLEECDVAGFEDGRKKS